MEFMVLGGRIQFNKEKDLMMFKLLKNIRDIRKGVLLIEIKIVGICIVYYYLYQFLYIILFDIIILLVIYFKEIIFFNLLVLVILNFDLIVFIIYWVRNF